MAKRPDFKPLESARGWVVNVPKTMTTTGKRARKYFQTLAAAKKFAASVRASHNSGLRGSMIPASLALQAAEAERILDGSGITLVEAARMAVAKLGGPESRESFGERYDRVLAAREMEWSGRYAADMRRLPRWVPSAFLALPCGGIDRAAMESALTAERPIKRSTLDNRCRYLSAVLNYRERHRKASTIAILSPAQAGRCLRACESAEERRVVAILLFAGIRPDSESGEISRLDWAAFGADEIYVSGEVSKTPSDRHIPITPRLRRLVKSHPSDGPVMPAGWKKRWQRIRRDALIADLIDVTRHTFCSNALAAWGMDACQAAMGHVPLSQVTRRHYARAVLRADAVRYFR